MVTVRDADAEAMRFPTRLPYLYATATSRFTRPHERQLLEDFLLLFRAHFFVV